MKLLTAIFLVSLSLVLSLASGCDTDQPRQADSSWDSFGQAITSDSAVEASELMQMIKGGDTVRVKVRATVSDVCQKKGCWLTVGVTPDHSMRVSFYDYSFFVPKDATGRTAILEGVAFYETTSVEDLRHYAEDAGASPDDIAAIDEAAHELVFEARGVLLSR